MAILKFTIKIVPVSIVDTENKLWNSKTIIKTVPSLIVDIKSYESLFRII